MEERGNKTIICSVFFLDIVEYSKKSVAGQISLKERFNAFLSIAIRDVPVSDRIILDTGDGAAISFLGDISDALHAALSMRSSLLSEGVQMEPHLLVRMGINLGPVRLVKDINGQPNIVGDGINVAQRVMGFADSGQILVSRSYYDAVSRLSQEYGGMFHYQGARTDKHVREHEVYAIGYPGDFTSTQRSQARQLRLANATGFKAVLYRLRNYWDIAVDITTYWKRRVLGYYRQVSSRQRMALIGAALVLLASLVVMVAKLPNKPASAVPKVAVAQGKPTTVVQSSPVSAPTAAHQVSPPAEKKVQGIKESSRVRTLAETTGAPAVVSLVVKPWGEIYLDGKKQGISPPLMELQVLAGKHVVKIRNSAFPVITKVIHVKSGEKIKIMHEFAN